ncbi:hypothetical protein HDU88_005296 [Geranomyces variabilis]|nr:hypothetical protein HDU88_005296 [Geranomyces variabilis]
MAEGTDIKALVVGSLNGNFKQAFAKIAAINSKHGPFALLLCVGDFFGPPGHNEDDVDLLVGGQIQVPLPAYIIAASNPLPKSAQMAVERNHGEICDQLMFLGESGTMTTVEGLKIAYLGGTQAGPVLRFAQATVQSLCESATSNPLGVDILMTAEWPAHILEGSTAAAAKLGEQQLGLARGVDGVAAVASALQPRYHFAGSPALFLEREPYRNSAGAKHVTRFIGLGEFQSKTKERWFYAMKIVPMTKIDAAALGIAPPNTTPDPFFAAHGQGSRKRPAEQMSDSFFFNSKDTENKRAKGRRPPPAHYVCRKCSVPGHWMEDCPTAQQSNGEPGAPRVPPAHYVCRLCNVPGHYISDCPQAADKGRQQSIAAKNALQQKDANQCWFCLSNPQLEKQLIVSVGSEAYVTLAKGGLVDWGGHLLVIPVAHYPSLRQMQLLEGEEAQTAQEAMKEMDKIKAHLFDVYRAREEVMVCFEMFGGGTVESLAQALHHMHLQVVPLPAALLPEIEPAFMEEAKLEGLELVPEGQLPEAVTDMYCRVEIPTGEGRESKVLVFRPSALRVEEHQRLAEEAETTGRRAPRIMNLQFGRKVLACLLGTPAAADWKRVMLPPQEEEKLTRHMRELVKLDI